MLDQSFSAHNFEQIFDIEIRKGNIDSKKLPVNYNKLHEEMKKIIDDIKSLKKIKKVNRTDEQNESLKSLNAQINVIKKAKAEELAKYISELADTVASRNYNFHMYKTEIAEKEAFYIDKNDYAAFFAMKQLQYNIKKTFKVKQANRHAILSNIKSLLNSKIPLYVIRTDISGFYESIPKKRLLDMIGNNTLLSFKSLSFINAIINQYEELKDTSKVRNGIGIPRGIGISAYLSELYLRDIDSIIKKRNEVMFYARYVDDIFIILSALPIDKTLELYYKDISDKFDDLGLKLKQPDDSSDKCILKDFTKCNVPEIKFDYLGYKLCMKRSSNRTTTTFALSDQKKERFKERIKKAFILFKDQSHYNIKIARKDLIDCINYISGNTRLYKSKKGVKIGIYYNNDLLDIMEDLDELTVYLKSMNIEPYNQLENPIQIENAIRKRINKVDFKKRWIEKKMYKFSMERLKKMKQWLKEER